MNQCCALITDVAQSADPREGRADVHKTGAKRLLAHGQLLPFVPKFSDSIHELDVIGIGP
jgi:hypothetical protein